MGNDPVSGTNFDHRKGWIEQQLVQLAAAMGIDLLGFALLSNHFHLILRSRPDVVETWDDTEVARRWLMLCPQCCVRILPPARTSKTGSLASSGRAVLRPFVYWLLDDEALLACAAYVDLNPIRAGLSETLEGSDFTSVQRRIQALENDEQMSNAPVAEDLPPTAEAAPVKPRAEAELPAGCSADTFLAPLSLGVSETGPLPAAESHRCSDKGFCR